MLVAQGKTTGDIIRILAQQHAEVPFLDLDLTLQRGDQGLGTGQLHLGLVVSRLGSKSALIAKLRQANTLTACVQSLLYDRQLLVQGAKLIIIGGNLGDDGQSQGTLSFHGLHIGSDGCLIRPAKVAP